MNNLEKEIDAIIRSLLAALNVDTLPQAEPLIELTVRAILKTKKRRLPESPFQEFPWTIDDDVKDLLDD